MKRTKPPSAPTMSAACCARKPIQEARAKRAKGEITADALKAIEDREIERVIKKQEDVGLQAITDGEFRRSWWHLDFLWGLDGAEKHVMDTGIALRRACRRGTKASRSPASSAWPGRIRWSSISSSSRRTPSARRRSPSRRRRRSTAGR